MMRGRNTELPVSTHGVRRLRKRVGLPARAAVRQLQKVLAEGLRIEDLTGPVRVVVEEKRRAYQDQRPDPAEYRVYAGFLYIFDGENHALITVLPLKKSLLRGLA